MYFSLGKARLHIRNDGDMQAITIGGNPELARRVFLYIAHGAVNEWSYTEYQTTGKNALVNSRITTSQELGRDRAGVYYSFSMELRAEELEKHPLLYWKSIHIHTEDYGLWFSGDDDKALDDIKKRFPGGEIEIMRPRIRRDKGIGPEDGIYRFNDFLNNK